MPVAGPPARPCPAPAPHDGRGRDRYDRDGEGGLRTLGPRTARLVSRALGVDVGTVRVGLAISDPSRVVATPLDTLLVDLPGDDDAAWAAALAVRLATVAGERACETVVVGLPRALSGRDTASTRLARRVADALRSGADGVAASLEVATWDERFSSTEAERVLLGAGRRRAQRRDERDRVAAAIILQGWLDARPR